VEVVSVDVLEAPVELWARASAPGAGRERRHRRTGTTSWLALSLPQALRPRHATAKRTATYVRM
jgi:hypothetical protein